MSEQQGSPFSPPRSTGGRKAREVVAREGWVTASDHPVLDAIVRLSTDSPRALQAHIGPSELGGPCTRKLALRSIQAPGRRGLVASWRTRVGVGVHAWLADGLPGAWKGQRDVTALHEVPLWIEGTGDDRVAGSADVVLLWREPGGEVWAEVVDFKVVGPSTLEEAEKAKIDPTYVVQLHTYGLGVQRTLGVTPRRVTILYLPAAGELSAAVPVSADWDPGVAIAALDRLRQIRALARSTTIAQIAVEAGTAHDRCHECQFLRAPIPGGSGVMCRGAKEESAGSNDPGGSPS